MSNSTSPSSLKEGLPHETDHDLEPVGRPHSTSSLAYLLNKRDNYVTKIPDGGLVAWLQVVGCFFIFMNNFGLASAFGVYQAYYQETMLANHSPSSISWIGTTQASLTLIVGVASGPLFDKGFFFPVVTVASVGLVFSFMMLSLCHQFWQVLLCQGILAGICTGLLYIPSIAQIPQYFSTNLGFALGIVLSGAPVGGIIYPYMFRELLPTIGFGGATRAIGFLALGLLAISIVLVKPLKLADAPEKLMDKAMFKNIYYVSFIIGAFFFFVGMMIPYFDCATFWWAKFDHNLDSAFHTLLIINAGNFFGRIILTMLVDYKIAHQLGPEGLIAVSAIGLAALGFGWIGVTTRASYYAFLVLWGFFSGGVASLPAMLLRCIVTRRELFATCLGIIYAAAGVGVLIGVPIANSSGTGKFLTAQVVCGVASTIGLVFTLITGVGARKNRMAKKV
ncbi:hypothetical protein ANO11243_027460 [Dothideomycetidae sp. 11243]|nr:hypothetical protein ANO11243_027460 [fungal sp. No.11243]